MCDAQLRDRPRVSVQEMNWRYAPGIAHESSLQLTILVIRECTRWSFGQLAHSGPLCLKEPALSVGTDHCDVGGGPDVAVLSATDSCGWRPDGGRDRTGCMLPAGRRADRKPVLARPAARMLVSAPVPCAPLSALVVVLALVPVPWRLVSRLTVRPGAAS